VPYTKEHKQKSRERILESASRLFSHRGYAAVSIDDLMRDAGLTRGAFYNHFSDKAEVYAEAIIHAAMRSARAVGKATESSSLESLHDLLSGYLSREHIDNSGHPCPLAFLVTDVGTREFKVRESYTRVYRNLVRLIGKRLPPARAKDRREAIMAVTAIMIGGVAVGRALISATLADQLLASCRSAARRILEQA